MDDIVIGDKMLRNQKFDFDVSFTCIGNVTSVEQCLESQTSSYATIIKHKANPNNVFVSTFVTNQNYHVFLQLLELGQ